jgi:hypothetical protein
LAVGLRSLPRPCSSITMVACGTVSRIKR